MPDWGWLAERVIQQAMEDGAFSNLPREGKPLQIEDDSLTPAHLRLAYKILRDNNLAPEWMLLGQDLDERRRRLLANILRGLRAYQGALGDAERIGDLQRANQRKRQIDAAWETAWQTFYEAASNLNRQIASYNLKVPAGISHKPYLDIECEIHQMLTRK